MDEFSRILMCKFQFNNEEISFFTSVVSEAALEISRPEQPVQCICRDASDDYVLACASQSEADYLVTGDIDLLALKKIGITEIITIKDFIKRLK